MCHCGCAKLIPKPKDTDSGHCCIVCNHRISATFTCFVEHNPDITSSCGICRQCAKGRRGKSDEELKCEYETWIKKRQVGDLVGVQESGERKSKKSKKEEKEAVAGVQKKSSITKEAKEAVAAQKRQLKAKSS